MGNMRRFLEVGMRQSEPLGLPMYFDRPEAVDKSINAFLVISVPSGIRYREIGGSGSGFDWSESTMSFEIFVRDLMQASHPTECNIPSLDSYSTSLISLFPMVDRESGVVIVSPHEVIPSASDNNGFHYCRIHASVTTAG